MAGTVKKVKSNTIKETKEINLLNETYNLINGTANSDTLIGTTGNDRINGLGGDDKIKGGRGNDILNGGSGYNIFNFSNGDGSDIIEKTNGVDTVILATQSALNFRHDMSNNDLLMSYGNNDRINFQDYYTDYSHSVKKISNGGQGLSLNDALTLYGVEIAGTSGVDNIIGSDGDDTINAGEGNDKITGGKGNDTINAGSGYNVMIFQNGDGHDTIQNSNGIDSVMLLDDTTLKFAHDMNNQNLIMSYGNNDSINFENYYVNNRHSAGKILNGSDIYYVDEAIDTYGISIKGTNASESITGGAGDDIIEGGRGNDLLNGGSGYNIFKFSEGDGADTIEKTDGMDTIKISTASTLKFEHDLIDNNLRIYYNDIYRIYLKDYYTDCSHSVKQISNGGDILSLEETLRLYGVEITGTNGADNIIGSVGNDIINAGAGNDQINGGEGDDIINAGAGNDTITAGKGNDVLNGGAGNNVFKFNLNDGNDIIQRSSGNDSIKIETETSIRFAHDMNNQDLVMNYGNGDSVTLQDYYENNSHSVKKITNGSDTLYVEPSVNYYGIDIIGTNGNDNMIGSDGNDTLIGNAGNDKITGGRGDDILDGGSGQNVFVFQAGDGQDIIQKSNGQDTVMLGIPSNIRFAHNMNNLDLVMNYGNNDSITLQDYFVDNSHSVKKIVNGSFDNVLYTNQAINTYGMDITGTNGNDTITGSNADDTIRGTLGDDVLNGGSGNNIFIFQTGDGQDIIKNSTGNDSIYINNTSLLDFTRESNNLRISYGTGNDSIILENYYVNNSHSVGKINTPNGVVVLSNMNLGSLIDVNAGNIITGTNNAETITGTDGADFIHAKAGNDVVSAGAGNDTIYGGTGNDTLDGGTGNDTFVFNAGDGHDFIVNNYNYIYDSNTIEINGTSDIRFARNMNNNDLVINYGNNDSIQVQDFYSTALVYSQFLGYYDETYRDGLKTIQSEGVTRTIGGAMSQYGVDITGTDADDMIIGHDGNDTIIGGAGNDTIFAHAGNDTIDGGAGNDTYVFSGYDNGNKTILNGTGNDRVSFLDSSYNFDLRFSRDMSNNDLKLSYNLQNYPNLGGTVTLDDYYVSGGHSVKDIKNRSVIKSVEETINQYGINILGTSGNDTITGSAGNDNIIAGDGFNIIYCGRGNDYIEGGNSYNSCHFNVGDGHDIIKNEGLGYIHIAQNVTLNLLHDLSNNDLVISYSNSDTITLKDYFGDSNGSYFVSVNSLPTRSLTAIINETGIYEYNSQAPSGNVAACNVNNLKEDVTAWASKGAYAPAQEVAENVKSADITAIIAEYQANAGWQK